MARRCDQSSSAPRDRDASRHSQAYSDFHPVVTFRVADFSAGLEGAGSSHSPAPTQSDRLSPQPGDAVFRRERSSVTTAPIFAAEIGIVTCFDSSTPASCTTRPRR